MMPDLCVLIWIFFTKVLNWQCLHVCVCVGGGGGGCVAVYWCLLVTGATFICISLCLFDGLHVMRVFLPLDTNNLFPLFSDLKNKRSILVDSSNRAQREIQKLIAPMVSLTSKRSENAWTGPPRRFPNNINHYPTITIWKLRNYRDVRVHILIWFQTFCSSQNPIFRPLMHRKAHLFKNFRLFQTFSSQMLSRVNPYRPKVR